MGRDKVWKMRAIPCYEKRKRGCTCCHDVVLKKKGKAFTVYCPHKECPYHVLDKYDSYEQFMASEDSKILVDGFFDTVAGCYTLANGNATVKDVLHNSAKGRFL